MDEKAIAILTKTFRCSKCREVKPGSEFRRTTQTSGNRPVRAYCKICQIALDRSKRPKCVECNNPKNKLNKNNVCATCNKRLGMRQCSSCAEILLLHFDFELDPKGCIRKQCRNCTGFWNKETTLKDAPILKPDW